MPSHQSVSKASKGVIEILFIGQFSAGKYSDHYSGKFDPDSYIHRSKSMVYSDNEYVLMNNPGLHTTIDVRHVLHY